MAPFPPLPLRKSPPAAAPAVLAAAAALTAYLCDAVLTPLHAKGYQPHEPSSECIAVLFTLLLPASAPYYVVVAGSIAAVFVKEAFGGEGHYPFHPSAVALAVVGLSWPDKVFFYPAPGTALPLWDASAAPLSAGMNATLSSGGLPTATTLNLVIGNVAGPMGASCILVVLACGLFLLCRGHLKLSVFLPYLAVCVLVPWLLPNLNDLPAYSLPWEFVRQRMYLEKYIILSGAMLFGGIFLAGEPVTQPVRLSSRVLYGLALGAFAAAVLARHPGTAVRVQKTQIAFANRHVFACASQLRVKRRAALPDPYLVVTLGMPHPLSSPRVAALSEPYPGRWTAHIVIGSAADVDAELLGWVETAYAFAQAK